MYPKLTFDKENNTARNQVQGRVSQSHHKDYPSRQAHPKPECCKLKSLKGGAGCAMEIGIPQLHPHSYVALLGSTVLRGVRPADCEVGQCDTFFWISRDAFKRQVLGRVAAEAEPPHSNVYWSQELCLCRVPTRKRFRRARGGASSRIPEETQKRLTRSVKAAA